MIRIAISSAIAAMLAGCAGSGTAAGGIAGPLPPSTQARERGGSWMSPGAKSIKRLLYVSDWSSNEVDVYDYKTGAMEGALSDFAYPFNQCVDKKGDVWITYRASSDGFSSLVEYAHGGTQPLKTLSVDGQPQGCSIDPTSGDLAVATVLYGPSELAVFKGASGNPKIYSVGACDSGIASPGYDDRGNLFVEGVANIAPDVCELAHGSKELTGPVQLNGFSINSSEGGVMWDGKYLTLSDQEGSGIFQTAVYRVKESASGELTKVGKTLLESSCGGDLGVLAPFIVGAKNTPDNRTQGKAIVGSNVYCSSEFDYWAYPAGGSPTATLKSPPAEPVGQSVSLMP